MFLHKLFSNLYTFFPINLSILRTVKCTRNEDCDLTEACIDNGCRHPCDLQNPCAANAVCINTNHGSDCRCAENYHGNGYAGCQYRKNFTIEFETAY